MLAALWHLKTALDEGLVTTGEFEIERRRILAGDLSRWTGSGADGVSAQMQRLQETVDTLVSMITPEASSQVNHCQS